MIGGGDERIEEKRSRIENHKRRGQVEEKSEKDQTGSPQRLFSLLLFWALEWVILGKI